MRRLWPRAFALALTVLVGGVAEGQITLVPGVPHQVARSPEFASHADYNKDGFEDAVVSNGTDDKMTVLFGQDGTNFGQVIDFSVGRGAGRNESADVNRDGNADIVTIDASLRRFYIIYGAGNGSFTPPQPYGLNVRGTARRPIDLAIGNFDNQSGLDILLVGRNTSGTHLDRISVVRSLGGTDYDTANPADFEVGDNPKRALFEDLNGDGYSDAEVLNTGASGADDVSILMNKAIQGGSATFFNAVNYVVGQKAVDLAIADFNNDGTPDIVVLNDRPQGSTTNEFSASMLLNRPQTVGGRVVGTGTFQVVSPVDNVPCPAFLAGISIGCTPVSVTTGDFDNDGCQDYAVSFSTHALNQGNIFTQGVLVARRGHCNGTFELSTTIAVGLNPRQIRSGDFNGDGVPDIVVPEKNSRDVRIVISVPPPPLPNGSPCNVGHQCASNNCVNDTCCSSAACPADQRCDIPGYEGMCHDLGPLGNPCDSPDQCASGFCVDDFCCLTRQCPLNEFCNSGTCMPPAPNGTQCSADEQCQSLHCTDGVCCSDGRCPAGQACNIPGFEGQCSPRVPNGTGCTDDQQCISGFCTDGFCCNVDQCPVGQSCGVSPREGLCTLLPTPTPTTTATVTPTKTPTPAPIGNPCVDNANCASMFCTDGICCDAATCPTGQRCNITGHLGMCTTPVPTGGVCEKDSDCASGNCQPGNPPVCAPPKTATPTPTATPKSPGDVCSDIPPNQCEPGYFCNPDDHVCCDLLHCPSGSSCRVPGSEGQCTLLPPTPTPLRDLGQRCTSPAQCKSGFCTDSTCCSSEGCPEGERCDIYGFEGDCSSPLGANEPCNKNTDCLDPLLCLPAGPGGSLICYPAPTPTEGLPETPVPTVTPKVILNTSSGGGCSIGDRNESTGLWLMLSLPLVLWMRRYSLQHAVSRVGK